MAGFDEIIGNEQNKRLFINAIESDKVAHGYILSGEDGIGKLTFANAFAMTLQCATRKTKPCGECRSCKQFINGNQPDVIYVKHDKAGTIGVDDIREQVNDDILIKPYSSPYKIYIIDEAEKMTIQAQNALLKTIEEPPSYGIIILLTINADVFLQTILSRCIVVDIKLVSDKEMETYLKSNGEIDGSKIDTIIKFAAGNIGKALKLAESEDFSRMVSDIIYLLKNVNTMDTGQMIDELSKLSKYKLEINDCIDFMQRWYRDVLLFKVTKDVNLINFKDEIVDITEIANRTSYQGIEFVIKAMDKAKKRLAANVNFELTLQLLLYSIKENG